MMLRKWVTIISFFVTGVAGIFLVFDYIWRLSHDQGNSKVSTLRHVLSKKLDEKSFPDFKLKALSGEFFTLQDFMAERSLAIFFSPSDCSYCLDEAKFWQKLHEQNKSGIKIFGFIKDIDTNAISRFCDLYGISFPILLDRHGILFKKLEVQNTPLKVIINEKGNIIAKNNSTYLNFKELYDFINLTGF